MRSRRCQTLRNRNLHAESTEPGRLPLSDADSSTNDESDRRASAAMVRYGRGERVAFGEVYELLAPRLRRLCRYLVGPVDAEELLQEVFLKMHRVRSTFSEGSVAAWSFAIARTTCVDRRRYRSRRPEASTEPTLLERHAASTLTHCPESTLAARALERVLGDELARTSEPLRAAYALVRLEGLSCREAASLLRSSNDAVKQRVHRASEALKPALIAAGW